MSESKKFEIEVCIKDILDVIDELDGILKSEKDKNQNHKLDFICYLLRQTIKEMKEFEESYEE